MKLTLKEMNGLLNGKCLPSDLIVGETLTEYLVRKFAEADAKCAALAAENAGLKNQLRELFNSCDTGERRGNGSLSGAAVPDWCVLEKTRQFLESAPATDAFLAEVRAQGVEMFANELGNVHKQLRSGSNHAHAIKSAVFRAVDFAAQLRKGVQS